MLVVCGWAGIANHCCAVKAMITDPEEQVYYKLFAFRQYEVQAKTFKPVGGPVKN